MNNYRLYLLYAVTLSLILTIVSCEKEITVELPKTMPKIVVEGSIVSGQQPLVMLTWSQGYFDPTDLNTLQNLFVHDAEVVISDGSSTYTLDELCTSDLTPEQLELAAQFLGVSAADLQAFNVCIYTHFGLTGQPGTLYSIDVKHGDTHLTGMTRIPELVYLSDVRFEIISPLPNDSLGFIFAKINDPDTLGNAYRWFAKRINHYPQWVPDETLRGQQKDLSFIAPLGSVVDDTFFNGLEFEFAYYRGTQPNSNKFDDRNLERGYFKQGDTVVVRGCVIDRKAYQFLYAMETMVANQGSPFSLPANLPSNIEGGGLGAFIGYGAVYDTIVCN
jgi:hypothetical protein